MHLGPVAFKMWYIFHLSKNLVFFFFFLRFFLTARVFFRFHGPALARYLSYVHVYIWWEEQKVAERESACFASV